MLRMNIVKFSYETDNNNRVFAAQFSHPFSHSFHILRTIVQVAKYACLKFIFCHTLFSDLCIR